MVVTIATATGSINLEELEALLQKSLSAAPLPSVPAKVECLFTEQTLTVLVHYPETALLYPQPTLRLLQQTLQQEQISSNIRVLSYIIVDGQENSAAVEDLLWQSTEAEIAEETSSASDFPQTMLAVIEETTNELGPTSSVAQTSSPSWDSLIPAPDIQVEELADKEKGQKNFQSHWGVILTGTGLGLALLLVSGYVLTRPCTLGKCQEMEEAKALAQEAGQSLTAVSSAQDLATVRQYLVKSSEQLELIPPWSRDRAEATNLLKVYRARLATLEEVAGALEAAAKATSLAENPPLPLSQWQKIKQLWQEAIATLAKIPAASEFYPLGLSKIQEYQRNLAIVEEQLKGEEKATASLKSAVSAAKIAQARQNAAQSLTNWLSVQISWETAIKRLREIPPGTTAQQKAQELLPSYLSQLAAATTRTSQEQFAVKIYNQATEQAQLAQQAELSKQWSVAVSHWRNALSYSKQVPANSFQSLPATQLVAAYTKELERTQVQLRLAVKLEQAMSDLDKTCSSANKICEYTVTNEVIKVKLTPTYTEQVFQAALRARAEDNVQTQVDLLAQISTLEQSLTQISQNTGIRVEVYNSEGVLLVTYAPR